MSQSRYIGYKRRMGMCHSELLVDKDLEGEVTIRRSIEVSVGRLSNTAIE